MISTVERLDASITGLVRDRLGGLSKGGMASKLEAARLATTGGENVIIASGAAPDILPRIIAGEVVGTLFPAQGKTVAARKRWIGLTVKPRGRLLLDAGAQAAVELKGRSLLAAGVVECRGRVRQRRRRGALRSRRRRVRPRTDQLHRRGSLAEFAARRPKRSPACWAIAPTTKSSTATT